MQSGAILLRETVYFDCSTVSVRKETLTCQVELYMMNYKVWNVCLTPLQGNNLQKIDQIRHFMLS
ncbi:MAG: hypothetical protein NVSMB44_42160 [Ktedonobacteraceae bacterium]